MLIRQADSTVDPRKAFRRYLTAFLTEEVNHGHEIILTGDFNERLGDDPSGMSKIAATFELIDIMHQQHPHLNDPATYARGSKRFTPWRPLQSLARLRCVVTNHSIIASIPTIEHILSTSTPSVCLAHIPNH